MNLVLIKELIQNGAMLVGVVIIFDVIISRWNPGRMSIQQVVAGLCLGMVGIGIMLTPAVFSPGIVFDTRSILIALTGLFFGLVPTLLVMAFTAAYRISQGGAVLTGVLVILAMGGMGIGWRHLRLGLTIGRRWALEEISWRELYLFGLAAHLVMMLLMFTLPWETALAVLSEVGLPVLVIYPLGTAVLGALLANRLRRERVDQELRESEARLRLAVSAADIGFFVRDLTNGQEHLSPEWKKQLGYEDHEIKDSPEAWTSRVHPEDLQRAITRENDYIEGRRPDYESSFRMRHKDGSYHWMLSRGFKQVDEKGRPVKMLGCHIDITTLKQAELDLQKSEELYRMLTETMKDVVWVLDVETLHFRYVSPSVEGLRGYTAAEIMAQPLDAALTSAGSQHFHSLIGDKLAGLANGETEIEEFFTDEVEQPCKDGSTVWTEAITKFYLNPETGRIEVLGVTRDISERKRVEAEVQAAHTELKRMLVEADQARQVLLSVAEDQKRAEDQVRRLNADLEKRVHDRTAQLETANQELEAFAYSVSHDLRAPLRAMDGFSAALLQTYSDVLDEQGRHFLNRIQEASRRMGQLISDLLSLSRVTRTELVRQRLNLTQLAQEIANELLTQEPQRRVKFDILPNMIVLADKHLLRIVLENLLNNAYKFTSRCEQAVIQVGMSQEGNESIYFVKDNGVGFDMAYARNLFAPFQRLHGIHEFPGTGIGLVTVQRIIRRHGGRIWPEAEVNRGATFYFSLGGN